MNVCNPSRHKISFQVYKLQAEKKLKKNVRKNMNCTLNITLPAIKFIKKLLISIN